VTWEPFELHPEIPPEGIPFEQYFAGRDISLEQMRASLKQRAEELGLPYTGNSDLVVSTRPALVVSEFVREKHPERYPELHHALFQAYFVHGRNLAQEAEVEAVCQQLGFEPGIVAEAMANPKCDAIIDRSMDQAREYGITGIPTWIVNDRYKVVGAQPFETLRDAFLKIEAMGK
jgi:predicted DsbA family dithiol-disulfide isomerase